MPNLFDYLGYTIYFWSNENFEPIHVHVSKGSARSKSTKIWLTKNGNCIVANNNSNIPEKELHKIIKSIEGNFFLIVQAWKMFYGVEEVKFIASF